ncbi:DUF1643 domain-containing protein [Gemmobacter nectariphilus]|uniref:DUF1643 domain-containing protein n=1 Tax=Gemmobacter nectariphilus TaxID=220343 RepID=UPI0004150355|nr:DUF1643 domain-containing protein [Gemmobacter nectariphilus]
MILRNHRTGGISSQAVYSDCGAYRHALHRRWGDGPVMGWVMLNPSTATEAQDDPTIARCSARARATGFGGIAIGNLFAYRATDPRDLKRAGDPVGPHADAALLQALAGADLLVCGWGNHGAHRGRDAQVIALLRGAGHRLHHLGLTGQGQPRHPLYTAYSVAPMAWD